MISEKKFTRLLEDMETGEVIPIYDEDVVKIYRATTKKYLNETIEINKEKKFTKSIDNAIRLLPTLDLTKREYDILTIMISFLGWGFKYSGYIVKTKNRVPYGYMNGEEIRKYTKYDKSAFSKGVKVLEEKGIIKKVVAIEGDGNNFILNPFIYTHDKRIPKTIFKMFEKTKFNYTKQALSLDSKEKQEEIKKEREENEAQEKR